MLNAAAQKYGLKLGAESVVAGTNIEDTIKAVGTVAHDGMRTTDEVILGIMIQND